MFGVDGFFAEPRSSGTSRPVLLPTNALEEALALGPYSRQILSDLLPRLCEPVHRASTASGRNFFSCGRSAGPTGRRPAPLAPTLACRHPLRRLVGCLSRQQHRQATQRGQPDAVQGVGAGGRTAPHRTNRQLPKQALWVRCGRTATAHKLLRVVYYCTLGKPCRDPDYKAVKRNAPRPDARNVQRTTKATCMPNGRHGHQGHGRQPERRGVEDYATGQAGRMPLAYLSSSTATPLGQNQTSPRTGCLLNDWERRYASVLLETFKPPIRGHLLPRSQLNPSRQNTGPRQARREKRAAGQGC